VVAHLPWSDHPGSPALLRLSADDLGLEPGCGGVRGPQNTIAAADRQVASLHAAADTADPLVDTRYLSNFGHNVAHL